MDGNVIDRVFKKNCPIYRGVFASDNLPDLAMEARPLVLVANTDPKTRPGKHWICMYFSRNGKGEYFDSLGLKPKDSFKQYLSKNCKDWTYNTKQLQSIIYKFCGHYCVWFSVMKNRSIALHELLKNVSNDTGLNDFLVHRFVCRLLLV